jgi:hypothetical protein
MIEGVKRKKPDLKKLARLAKWCRNRNKSKPPW